MTAPYPAWLRDTIERLRPRPTCAFCARPLQASEGYVVTEVPVAWDQPHTRTVLGYHRVCEWQGAA